MDILTIALQASGVIGVLGFAYLLLTTYHE